MDKWRPEAAGVSTVDPDCGAGVQGSGQQDGAQPSWWRDESTGAGAGPPGVSTEGSTQEQGSQDTDLLMKQNTLKSD